MANRALIRELVEALEMAEGTIARFRPEATTTLETVRAVLAKARETQSNPEPENPQGTFK